VFLKNTQSDEELMLALRDDADLSAFEQIVVRHQSMAWRVAYRFTGDAVEAEDLAQKSFLRIFAAAPRYRATASFRTYFLRILSRLCIDYARKKRPVPTDPLPNVADPRPSPSKQTEQREREQLVSAALNGLQSKYRMAILLRYFEGLSAAEMAKTMGVSVKAVERLLARAREKLEPRLRSLVKD
jgi:RNA polymerase sigma-70 factor (ECF subfamily)